MFLQNFPCNPGTGFGIGKGVVMVLQTIATLCCNGVKLMVSKVGEILHKLGFASVILDTTPLSDG
jgi:hypothetical protein